MSFAYDLIKPFNANDVKDSKDAYAQSVDHWMNAAIGAASVQTMSVFAQLTEFSINSVSNKAAIIFTGSVITLGASYFFYEAVQGVRAGMAAKRMKREMIETSSSDNSSQSLSPDQK